jgi:CDP-glucose 4,6-dehydratase
VEEVGLNRAAAGALSGGKPGGAFGGAFKDVRVLVTGHTGFKGSWLAYWLRDMGAIVQGLSLPPDTHPCHHALLTHGVAETAVDLRDAAATRRAVEDFAPEIIFHLAAQALVRRSYRAPLDTIETNVLGLVNLFEAARASPSVRAIVNATTDKCYENDGRGAGYRETDPMGGHDPYSASKACAEILSASWRRSFLAHPPEGRAPILLATARAGNVIGGGDWSEDRLVPDLVRAAARGEQTPIRYPHSTRPWQHVLEPLSGYLELGRRLLAGEERIASAWNFGPDPQGTLTVGEVAAGLQAIWPAITVRTDGERHPHEAQFLALDWSRAREELGWRPVWNARQTLERTAAWYRAWYEEGRVDTVTDLAAFQADARAAGLAWAGAVQGA